MRIAYGGDVNTKHACIFTLHQTALLNARPAGGHLRDASGWQGPDPPGRVVQACRSGGGRKRVRALSNVAAAALAIPRAHNTLDVTLSSRQDAPGSCDMGRSEQAAAEIRLNYDHASMHASERHL